MDLSILSTVNKPETVAPNEYVAPVDYSEPIAKVGDYNVRLIDGKFKDNETHTEDPFRLSSTKAGDMQVEVALEVIDGAYKGKRLYDRWNTAKFKNGVGNSMFNALMAFGNTATLSQPEDYLKVLDKAIKGSAIAKTFVSLEWYSNPKSKDYQGTGNSYKYNDAVAGGWILPDGIRIVEPNRGDEKVILLGRNNMSKYRATSLA